MVITTISQIHLPEQISTGWEEVQKVALQKKKKKVVSVPSFPFFAPTNPLIRGKRKRLYQELHGELLILHFQPLQRNIFTPELLEAKLADLWVRTFPLQ